ncbi:MAG: TrbC/VirB2 family protein [Candidatus Azambacteria bacterium]|nr:TrbC/VirB2 family protein [Candidatus Azambacteria bacterium]
MKILTALAQTVTIPNPLTSDSITGLVDNVATWLLGIGLTISTIVIIWAAIVFITSGGNTERVTMARKTLWYAIIGIVVLLLAKGVTSLVANFLGGNF